MKHADRDIRHLR